SPGCEFIAGGQLIGPSAQKRTTPMYANNTAIQLELNESETETRMLAIADAIAADWSDQEPEFVGTYVLPACNGKHELSEELYAAAVAFWLTAWHHVDLDDAIACVVRSRRT